MHRRVGLISTASVSLLLLAMVCATLRVSVVKGNGQTIYIRADGSVDPPTAPVSRVDNVTYILIGNITSDENGVVIERDNITLDGIGHTISGQGSSKGVSLSGRLNVTVRNAQIKNFVWGISVSTAGIGGKGSSSNIISGNNITNNIWGIYLHEFSDNNKICGNEITNNSYGVFFDGTTENNEIYGNNITNNELGICFDGYISSTYKECSENNKIYENNIADNTEAGVKLLGLDNIFCHNNFVNNTIVIGSEFETGGTNDPTLSKNILDDGYPSGGNCWSDYNGTDSNSDGIGDSPYVIDSNNVDHYPLVTQYLIPEFPSFFALALFIMTILLAVIVSKRKYSKLLEGTVKTCV